ncbi:flavodoxin family protein [bacterium]|nr:flavodoxin family protein [bacterium]
MGTVIVLNGSPRKNKNTAKMLKEAAKGAKEAGAEVEYFDLVDYNYKGCISCFACKRKGNTTNGLCAYKDELTPILEKVRNADAVIIGSPIYYSYQTGMFRNLIERMLFAASSYMKDETTGLTKRLLDKIINIGIIYTMNVTKEGAEFFEYPEILNPTQKYLSYIYGSAKTLCAYDTYQFDDYSKFDCDMFDEVHKAEIRDTQFPIDLEKAYEFGKKLAMGK